MYLQDSENNHHFTNHHLVRASIQRGGFESASEVLLLIRNISISPISILLRLPRLCVCLCAKFDQFLPVRSHFDTKRPVNFFLIATFPSPTFGPLFAFHCPLFFTKNNNLECRDVLKTVTVTCVCAKFDQFLTNFCPYALISTPNVP